MIDINILRTNPQIIKDDLKKRKDDEKLKLLEELINLDINWRKNIFELQHLKSSKNEFTREINELRKAGKDFKSKILEMQKLSIDIGVFEKKLTEDKIKIDSYLLKLPNITHISVPYGKDSSENVTVREVGVKRNFDFPLKSHIEISEKLGIADFDRSTKISGSGFFFLKGDLALLNQAIIRFAIDKMVKKKYVLVEPPLMMNRSSYEGVTDLSDFENVMYKVDGEDLYLIATSEHPMVAMHKDEVLDSESLPIRYVGLSQCFRREIGSHGIDEKGLFRRHQFTKVEQVVICDPKDSWNLHEEVISNAEELFRELELPFRVINICTGDIGTVAAKKYDIEVWMPRSKEYKEVVSASNCTDYQARRLNIKYGHEGGEKKLTHTLNSTVVATSRALVAILENYQNSDGSVSVPKVLQKYVGKEVIG